MMQRNIWKLAVLLIVLYLFNYSIEYQAKEDFLKRLIALCGRKELEETKEPITSPPKGRSQKQHNHILGLNKLNRKG